MESIPVEVVNFIPCRLSEPISALSMNSEILVFGAITGYIGFVRIDEKGKEATYIQEVFDQSIRSIYVSEENAAYVTVGSIYSLVLEFSFGKKVTIRRKTVTYTKQKYNHKLSPFTVAQIAKEKVLIQSFKLQEFEKVKKQIPKFGRPVLVDLKKEEEIVLNDLRITNFATPMDFNGVKTIWLEYKKDFTKQILLYDLILPKLKRISIVETFPESVESISHCKIIKTGVIYVKNRVQVMQKPFDSQARFLYTHKHEIISFIFIENDEKVDFISLDKSGKLKIWKDKSIKEFDLYSVQNQLPEYAQDADYFHLGFPYYMTYCSGNLAITCDQGVFLLKFEIQ